MSLVIKICGVQSVEDAALALEHGANWVGVNLVPGRRRAVTLDVARAIVEFVRRTPDAHVAAVLADAHPPWLEAVCALGVDALQLHGQEPPPALEALLARGLDAFKALGVRQAADVADAARYAGARVLFDAAARQGPSGGRGETFDWRHLASAPPGRPYWLAGGLTPDNVADAIAGSRADGVDVASGVEGPDGRKDAARMRAFVEAARQAFAARALPHLR